MKLVKCHIISGQEVVETLTNFLKQKKIVEGVIVSIIGAVDECTISTMPKDDAKRDIVSTYNEPLEMSGTGEIYDGKPHIHCVFGREGNKALFGHLHRATVGSWFVNIYINPLK
jgi:predicted DNA-binding protein with PD1-like motif